MRGKVKWLSMLVVLSLFSTLAFASETVLAEGPSASVEVPQCRNMPDAQIPGKPAGSACRVPVWPLDQVVGLEITPLTLYRSGWTHRWTSESDSDLVEELIKVEGYLYWWAGGQWNFEDDCEDSNTYSSHAACRTYSPGVSGTLRQDGYHYFHTQGYQDDWFQTQDIWSS